MIYSMDQLPRFQKNFGRPYIYKNMLLLMASDWFLNSKTLGLINEALPLTVAFEEEGGFESPEPSRPRNLLKMFTLYQCFRKSSAQCLWMKYKTWKSSFHLSLTALS